MQNGDKDTNNDHCLSKDLVKLNRRHVYGGFRCFTSSLFNSSRLLLDSSKDRLGEEMKSNVEGKLN